jgi:hypothetical protein
MRNDFATAVGIDRLDVPGVRADRQVPEAAHVAAQ